jgi:hypothetical protein
MLESSKFDVSLACSMYFGFENPEMIMFDDNTSHESQIHRINKSLVGAFALKLFSDDSIFDCSFSVYLVSKYDFNGLFQLISAG